MGNIISKKKKVDSSNIIKLISYNVDMENAVNMDTRISDIISYFEENLEGVRCDVMCIRGINNFVVYYKLVTMIKSKYKNNINIVPDYYNDNIDISNIYNKSEIKQIFNDNQMIDFAKKKKKKVRNIIISRHKIISTVYSELDDDIIIDDILGVHSIIGANIIINKKIYSFYNTALCSDIKYANIVNTHARKSELKVLFEVIKNNSTDLDKLVNKNNEGKKKHKLSNAHILTGTFNIPINEYLVLVNEMNCIDLVNMVKKEKEYAEYSLRNRSVHGICGNVYNKSIRKISPGNSDDQTYLSDYVFLYDIDNKINGENDSLAHIKKKLYDNYNIYVVSADIRKNFYGSDYLLRPSREYIIMLV